MKRLVIFDLDGTLLNTIADLGDAANYALGKNGFPTHSVEKIQSMVGNGIERLLLRALPDGRKDAATLAAVKPDFISYYDENNCRKTVAYDGIAELLLTLDGKGVALAVASNKYERAARKVIRHYFPDVAWAAIEGQTDARQVKPDPTIVFDILSETGTAAADALYVGDSATDIRTAQNAGVESVGVTWGFRPEAELRENGANHIADSPADILELAGI